jgi:NADH-quinone oxidoreductase subunit C
MSSPTTPDAPATEEAPAADTLRQPVLDALVEAFGDAVVGSEISGGDLWVRVDRSAWLAVASFLQEHEGFDHFTFLAGIDWLPSVEAATRYEKVWGAVEEEAGEEGEEDEAVEEADGAEEEVSLTMTTGVAGGDSRFQVLCRLGSIGRNIGITLKADLDAGEPSIDSLVPVFRGADWHERETWEMYGFDFVGHPGLRHLYLPGEFEGYPLRKDFPLLAREVKPWPGLVNVEALPPEPEAVPPEPEAVPPEPEAVPPEPEAGETAG